MQSHFSPINIMVLEVQNQQLQPLHVAGDYTAKGGGHNQSIAGRRHSDDLPSFAPSTLEFLNFQTGNLVFKDKGRGINHLERRKETTMSRRNGAKLELKLNLSPPRANQARVVSPSRSLSVSPTSPPSSCVSSELNQQDESMSPEATSMMLVGCPRCLMYVMLAEEDPRCPKCKSSVLLDIIHHDNNTNTTTARKPKKS